MPSSQKKKTFALAVAKAAESKGLAESRQFKTVMSRPGGNAELTDREPAGVNRLLLPSKRVTNNSK
jgi:hypothetical protein